MNLKKILKKTFVVIACALFVVTNHFVMPPVYAEMPVASLTSFKKLSLGQINIPEKIGKVVEEYQGGDGQVVLLIQDAHAIPDAQKNIHNLITYFQKTYGLKHIELEGAQGTFDAQIFKSFPDKKRLKEVFKEYYQTGEMSGGNGAIIFNGENTSYFGAEDWELYEEGLNLFYKANAAENTFLKRIQAIKDDLNLQKKEVYSGLLLKTDQLVGNFYDNYGNLLTLIQGLSDIKKPVNYPEVNLILQEANKKESADVEIEIKKIAKSTESFLNKKGRKEDFMQFQLKKQEYMGGIIDAEKFAHFIQKLMGGYGLSPKFSGELRGLISKERKLSDIKGTQLFEEVEDYIEEVFLKIASEYSGPSENRIKELMRKTKDLKQIEKLISLEVSFDELKEIRRNSYFDARVFSNHMNFYKNAGERDQAMLRNLLERSKSMESMNPKISMLVAGGFHTQAITQRLEEKRISYVLLSPEISRLPDENFYKRQMKGEVSWQDYFEVKDGKINLYDAFVRGMRDKLLSSSVTGQNVNQNILMKRWRDQIIRDLAKKGQVEKSSQYTRFIDEALGESPTKKSQKVERQEEWVGRINKFIVGLKKLKNENQITEKNVANLLTPSFITGLAGLPLSESHRSVNSATVKPEVDARSPIGQLELASEDRQVMKEIETYERLLSREVESMSDAELFDRLRTSFVSENVNRYATGFLLGSLNGFLEENSARDLDEDAVRTLSVLIEILFKSSNLQILRENAEKIPQQMREKYGDKEWVESEIEKDLTRISETLADIERIKKEWVAWLANPAGQRPETDLHQRIERAASVVNSQLMGPVGLSDFEIVEVNMEILRSDDASAPEKINALQLLQYKIENFDAGYGVKEWTELELQQRIISPLQEIMAAIFVEKEIDPDIGKKIESRFVDFAHFIAGLKTGLGKSGNKLVAKIRSRISDPDSLSPLIDEGDPVGNPEPVLTMMESTVKRHFKVPEEAARELITNAYDAMRGEPDPESREVRVKVGDGSLRVSDSGSGMSLDILIEKFFPPFSSGKRMKVLLEIKNILAKGKSKGDSEDTRIQDVENVLREVDWDELDEIETLALENIILVLTESSRTSEYMIKKIESLSSFTGQFGIGFYSVLKFLEKEGDMVSVYTSTGEEAYQIIYRNHHGRLQISAIPISQSAFLEQSEEGKETGTIVQVESESFNKESAVREIENSLSLNKNAKILMEVDGEEKFVNEEAFSTEDNEHLQDEYGNEIYFSKEKNTDGESTVRVSVHGVTIQTLKVKGYGLPKNINFNYPAVVGLPITRDGIDFNELFLEKSKEMIVLMRGSHSLLSAFLPVIEVLEDKAPKKLSGYLERAVIKSFRETQDYSKVYLPHDESHQVFINLENVDFVHPHLVRVIHNSYDSIGEFVIVEEDQNLTVDGKVVVIVDYQSNKNVVVSSNAIFINRNAVATEDNHIDIAMVNVLMRSFGIKGKWSYREGDEAVEEKSNEEETLALDELPEIEVNVEDFEDAEEEIEEWVDSEEVSYKEFENLLREELNKREDLDDFHVNRLAIYIMNKSWSALSVMEQKPSIEEILNIFKLADELGVGNHWNYKDGQYDGTQSFVRLMILLPEFKRNIESNETFRLKVKEWSENEMDHIFFASFESIALKSSTERVPAKSPESIVAENFIFSDEYWERFDLFQKALAETDLTGRFWSKDGDLLRLTRQVFQFDENVFSLFISQWNSFIHQYQSVLKVEDPLVNNQFGGLIPKTLTPYLIFDTHHFIKKILAGDFHGILGLANASRRLSREVAKQWTLDDMQLEMLGGKKANEEGERFLKDEFEVPSRAESDNSARETVYLLNSLYPGTWKEMFGRMMDHIRMNEEGDDVSGAQHLQFMAIKAVSRSGLSEDAQRKIIESLVEEPISFRGVHFFNVTDFEEVDWRSIPWETIENPSDFVQFLVATSFVLRDRTSLGFLKAKKNVADGASVNSAYDLNLLYMYQKEITLKLVAIFQYIENLPTGDPESSVVSNTYESVISSFALLSNNHYRGDKDIPENIQGFVDFLLSSGDLLPVLDGSEVAKWTVEDITFSLLNVYETFLDLSDETKVAEQENLELVHERVERAKVMELTDARRDVLGNDFRAASKQSIDHFVYLREVIQNVIDGSRDFTDEERKQIQFALFTGEEESDGSSNDLILEITDFIGMNDWEVMNKLLMPFSTTKYDPKKFLGQQGQGFFTLLANSNELNFRTVKNGIAITVQVIPVRDQNGAIYDYQIRRRREAAKIWEADGTVMQAHLRVDIPDLESGRVQDAIEDFAGMIEEDRLGIKLQGKTLNSKANSEKYASIEADSSLGKVRFKSTPGRNNLALDDLKFQGLRDDILEMIPEMVRDVLVKKGFSISFPKGEEIQAIQGRSDLANREEILRELEPAIVQGAIRLLVEMFSRGEIEKLDFFGYDFYIPRGIPSYMSEDGEALVKGELNYELFSFRYLGESNRGELSKLIRSIPLDFLADLFGDELGDKISLNELFTLYRETPELFSEEKVDQLPDSIKEAFEKIKQKKEEDESAEQNALDAGVPEELIDQDVTEMRPFEEAPAGMGAYWAFLDLVEVVMNEALVNALQSTTPEEIGEVAYGRIQTLMKDPPKGGYYAESRGELAHARQGENIYAFNIIWQQRSIELLSEFLQGKITEDDFLEKVFEGLLDTATHEFVHLVEGHGEETHNDLFHKRQRVFINAVIAGRETIKKWIRSEASEKYQDNNGVVPMKDFLEYLARVEGSQGGQPDAVSTEQSEMRNIKVLTLEAAESVVESMAQGKQLSQSEIRKIYEISLSDTDGLISAIEGIAVERGMDITSPIIEGGVNKTAQAFNFVSNLLKAISGTAETNDTITVAVDLEEGADSFVSSLFDRLSEESQKSQVLARGAAFNAAGQKVRESDRLTSVRKLSERELTGGVLVLRSEYAEGVPFAIEMDADMKAMADMFVGLKFDASSVENTGDNNFVSEMIYAGFLIAIGKIMNHREYSREIRNAVREANNTNRSVTLTEEEVRKIKASKIKEILVRQGDKLGLQVSDMENLMALSGEGALTIQGGFVHDMLADQAIAAAA